MQNAEPKHSIKFRDTELTALCPHGMGIKLVCPWCWAKAIEENEERDAPDSDS